VGTGKTWEAYRAYEKRLLTIASKDPEVKIVPQQKKKATAAEAEEGEMEDTDEEDREETPTRGSQSRQAGRADVVADEEGDEDQAAGAVRGSKRKALELDSEDDGGMEIDLEFDVPAPLDMEEDDDDDDDLPVIGDTTEGDANGDEDQALANDDDELADVPSTAEARARSVSVEPGVKKRKKARRF
jgi:hypothetical protein